MRPAPDRFALRPLEERLPLAQEPTQQRIHQSLRGGARDLAGRRDRLIDDGERRRLRMHELIERHRDERCQLQVGDRLRREHADEGIERAVVAQRAVRELVHEGACRTRVVRAGRLKCTGQGLAVEHAPDGEGGLLLRSF